MKWFAMQPNNNHEHECTDTGNGTIWQPLVIKNSRSPTEPTAQKGNEPGTANELIAFCVRPKSRFRRRIVPLILLYELILNYHFQAFSQIVKKVIGIESDKLCRSRARRMSSTIGGLRYLGPVRQLRPIRRYRDSCHLQVDLRVAG